jgi:hypothetical protein
MEEKYKGRPHRIPRWTITIFQVLFVLGTSYWFLSIVSTFYGKTYTDKNMADCNIGIVAAVKNVDSQAIVYRLTHYTKIEEFKRGNPGASFLLPEKSGHFYLDPKDTVSDMNHVALGADFSILKSDNGHQTIKLIWDYTDNYKFISKYTTDGMSVKPLYSSLMHPMMALMGLVLAILTAWIIGRSLKIIAWGPETEGHL